METEHWVSTVQTQRGKQPQTPAKVPKRELAKWRKTDVGRHRTVQERWVSIAATLLKKA